MPGTESGRRARDRFPAAVPGRRPGGPAPGTAALAGSTRGRAVALAGAALLSLGCDRGPADPIGHALRVHFEERAPRGLGVEWGAARFLVADTLRTPGGLLAVDFRSLVAGASPAGGDPPAAAATHRAYLRTGPGGPRVVAYSEDLARSVAVMIATDRRRRYADLLSALLASKEGSRAVLADWARPLRARFLAARDDAERRAVRERLDHGVPAAELRAGLAGRWEPPGGLEWGVVDDDPRNGAEIVFVRVRERPGEMCAYPLGPGVAPEYAWLASGLPTCRGRGGRYVEEHPPVTILDELRTGGWIAGPEAAGDGERRR